MNKQSNLLPCIPAMWPSCKWTNHSVARSGPTPLTKRITLAQEVNGSLCIHMDFTLWLTDFVTQKLDSLWQLLKTCNHPFSIPAAPVVKVAGECCYGLSWLSKSGLQPETNNHARAHKFPIRLTCKSVTVARRSECRQEIYTGGTHRGRYQGLSLEVVVIF